MGWSSRPPGYNVPHGWAREYLIHLGVQEVWFNACPFGSSSWIWGWREVASSSVPDACAGMGASVSADLKPTTGFVADIVSSLGKGLALRHVPLNFSRKIDVFFF